MRITAPSYKCYYKTTKAQLEVIIVIGIGPALGDGKKEGKPVKYIRLAN